MLRVVSFFLIGLLSFSLGAWWSLRVAERSRMLAESGETDAPSAIASAPPVQQSESFKQAHRTHRNLCLTCHRVANTYERQQAGLAPPLWDVRHHYLKHHADHESFTATMADYMAAPDAERSLMPEAIQRFGVMMTLNLPEEELLELASLVYDGRLLKQPTWWDAD